MAENPIDLDRKRQSRVARPGNGNGGGNGVRERLARLEAHMEHLATKADLQAMKSDLLKWMMGVIAVSTIALTAAVMRSFF